MTKTPVRAHARKGTKGVKRHSRNNKGSRTVPTRVDSSSNSSKQKKKQILKQQQDIIDYIKQDAKKKGEEVSIHKWDFEESLIESYHTNLTIESKTRGWSERKEIKSEIEGEKIHNRMTFNERREAIRLGLPTERPEEWRYKHRLTIRINNPHIIRTYRQKTKRFKNLSSYKKFYHDFTYINV